MPTLRLKSARPVLYWNNVWPGKRNPRHHLRFNQAEALAAEHRRSHEQVQEGRNLRAAVEATVRSVKHPFPAVKSPVRGKFRVACMLIGSAAVTNIRHIQRYHKSKTQAETLQNTARGQGESTPEQPGVSVFISLKTALAAFLGWLQPKKLTVGW